MAAPCQTYFRKVSFLFVPFVALVSRIPLAIKVLTSRKEGSCGLVLLRVLFQGAVVESAVVVLVPRRCWCSAGGRCLACCCKGLFPQHAVLGAVLGAVPGILTCDLVFMLV